MYQALLAGADLSNAFFDGTTSLDECLLGEKNSFAYLADIHWRDANLGKVEWLFLEMLGEEQDTRRKKTSDGRKKTRDQRLEEQQKAVRAYRQIAVALRNQGIEEIADRFAYRAQVLQRTVFRLQMIETKGGVIIPLSRPKLTFGRRVGLFFSWLFSWFLYFLAGYGYRPERSLLLYGVVIFIFTVAYSKLGGLPFLPDSLIFSLMSFHGRGFFPSLSNETNLHNPLVILAAFEAVIGLFTEISFIATFTQRFFGK